MERIETRIENRHQLGLRVRENRKGLKLTQRQLGLMLGIDRSYISRIECGRCNASFDNIVIIANGFGITPSELLEGIGNPTDMEGREL